jgi:hypothetical protein
MSARFSIRLLALSALMLALLGPEARAASVLLTPATISPAASAPNGASSFADAFITLTPLVGGFTAVDASGFGSATGTIPVTFNRNDTRLGIDNVPVGTAPNFTTATNPNAFNDRDIIPNNGNEEQLRIQMATGAALESLQYDFSRADGPGANDGVVISGFAEDPKVRFSVANAGIFAGAYNSGAGAIRLNISVFDGTLTTIRFANPKATAGRTLLVTTTDTTQAGAQFAVRGISYETAPGDVDTNGVVNLTDFGIIRDNFFNTGATRATGDLTGDTRVTIEDFDVWKDFFPGGGSLSFAQASALAVPEPATLGLVALAGLAVVGFRRSRKGAAATALLAAAMVTSARGQTINPITWTNTGVGDFATGSNWTGGFVPSETFNERAVIDNGGTAFVASPIASQPGAIAIGGVSPALGGTLEIRSGGSLTVLDNTVTDGNVVVGAGTNIGTLIVERGGSLTADVLSSANGASVIRLGGSTGAGTATVNLKSLVGRANTQVIGNTASVTSNQLQFTGPHTYAPTITALGAAGISAFTVNGPAQLAGTINANFSGVTPAAGNSWTLINSQVVVGEFGSVTSNATLGPGLRLVVGQTPGGLGQLTNLSVEQVLTLRVNQVTGATSIVNQSGGSVGMTGYNISSPSGGLSTGFTSLQSQSIGGFQTANPTTTQLSELTAAAATSVSATGLSLGTAYTTAVSFGTPLATDLGFAFTRNDGRVLNGLVEYVGGAQANTLVLTIDPANGNAQLKNDSGTNINLDVYSIASATGALRTTWSSLADQTSPGWQEANPSVNRVSELNPTGALPLNAGQSVTLNGLWNTSGVQNVSDLSLLFRDPVRGEFTGVVRFGSLTSVLIGDYNSDNKVDAADYTTWRDNSGTSNPLPNRDPANTGVIGPADYTSWKNNFGAMLPPSAASVAASAVPEPATWALTLGLAAMGLLVSRRNRRPLAIVSNDSQQGDNRPSLQTGKGSVMRSSLLAVVALAIAGATVSAQTKITGTSTAGLSSFTDGSITLTPFGIGGSSVPFGPSTTNIGPSGGTNANAVDDADGDPTTTADQEKLDITLASGIGLQQFEINFSRGNAIVISGFASDPLASFGANASNNGLLTYQSSTSSLLVFHSFFGATITQINFANTEATAGRTLSTSIYDYAQTAPQVSFTSFTYGPAATAIPGDVDGVGGVTTTDLDIIRTNFRTGTTRAQGDLTGNGAVTLLDFQQWRTAFGAPGASVGASLSVPEPSAVVAGLLVIGGLFAARCRFV